MKLFELITRTWSSHKTVPTLARGEPPLTSQGAQRAPFSLQRTEGNWGVSYHYELVLHVTKRKKDSFVPLKCQFRVQHRSE